jgi:6-pyruvoyl-tetrahydropterin synthase related domain
MSSQASYRSALLNVCLAATAVVAPMLFLGNVSGHDFRFHIESWMDAAGQWREGIFFPRWAEWANWGFGEPRFIFYPPLSWLVGAALGSALPWRMAPGVFIWIALSVAGMSMWCLAREWIPSPHANLAAALYAINPYHLVMVYYRSAFGELLAAALLPLVIWAALHVIEGGWPRVPILAVAFAGIWLSNAPAAVIATYSLGFILITGCVLRRSLRPLLGGASALAGGFALACFYIVPAAWEQHWVQIKQIVANTYRPSVNFIFTRANEPDFVAFNWKVSWVATGLILAAGIAALSTIKHRDKMPKLWWILSVLGLVSTALMLPPSVWLWRVLPKLWFIQFPWRWLDVVDVAFAFFVAVAIARLRSRAARWVVATIALTAIGAAATAMLRQAPWDSGDLPQIAAWIHDGRGYEGTDEYAPNGCDRYQLPGDPDDSERPAGVSPNSAPRIAKLDAESGNIVPAAGVRLHVSAWKSTYRFFTAEMKQPVILAPRLVYYPAWNFQMNGQAAKFDLLPEREQILLPLSPAGTRIQIRFRRTSDRTVGDAISLIATIALGGLAWRLRRRRAGNFPLDAPPSL